MSIDWQARRSWIQARTHILFPRFSWIDPWAARIAAAEQWENELTRRFGP